MKTSVLCRRFCVLPCVALLTASVLSAQTYTTIANGSWSSASTWQGGIIPPTNGNIAAGVVINIKHVVTYSGSNISNQGTINISNPGGPSPRLLVASGINYTSKSGGTLVINGGEYRQYRFAGGGESGASQTGTFTNGGRVSAQNSLIEVAQSYSNSGGVETFNNCVLNFGQGYTMNSGSSIDTLAFTSMSVGMQGSGNFSIANGNAYFKTLRVEVASSNGQFSLNNGTVNGSIDYITLKNHVTNTYSSNNINVASNISTSGLSLNAYCVSNSANYQPNGKISGSQTADCSLTYFPASITYATNTARLNFSTDPTLIAGTSKQVGAQYKYESVAPGMDALVSIDSIVNGAVIDAVDDNTGANGGFIEAFQPIIISGPAVGSSYAVFRFNYKVTGTSTNLKLDTASITALDIDGAATIHEFDQISLGAGAVASYWGSNPMISLSQVSPGIFQGIDVTGADHSGIDTVFKQNMFTATNKKVSSFVARLGMVTTTPQTTRRLFSLYAKSFNYPNPTPLPVKLIDFTARYTKPNATLAWKSAEELDFNYYELEHSSDGVVFATTAIVFGSEKSTDGADYTYVDKTVANRNGLIYYRLKMVDIDGHFTYSPVRIIRLEEANNVSVITYPNPVTNDLRITFPVSLQNKQLNVHLYNVNGQCVNTLNIMNSSQTESMSVASLQKGVYFLKINCGNSVVSQEIIKN